VEEKNSARELRRKRERTTNQVIISFPPESIGYMKFLFAKEFITVFRLG
jgi:hypothetical protein